MKSFLSAFLVLWALGRLSAGDFTVTNTNSSGPGSLYQAITDANNTQGADRVVFNIPGSGVHTINVSQQSGLPIFITESLVIDGYTQPGSSPNTFAVGNNAVLRIELAVTQSGYSTISTSAPDCVLRGLLISGSVAMTGTRNRLVGCFVGTNSTGSSGVGNGSEVRFWGDDSQLGGIAAGDRNVIAGRVWVGRFSSQPPHGQNLQILNNYIGIDATGSKALVDTQGAAKSGINVSGVAGVRIGGIMPAERNVVIGDVVIEPAQYGIMPPYTSVGGGSASIQGNYIGVRADGTAAPSPAYGAVRVFQGSHNNVIGGPDPGARNVVATQVFIGSNNNSVHGNYVGVDATGNRAIPGAGPFPAIVVQGQSNLGGYLVLNNMIEANVVCSTQANGVYLYRTVTTVRGNNIGVGADGVTVLPQANNAILVEAQETEGPNMIGGTGPGDGNMIAGGNNGVRCIPLPIGAPQPQILIQGNSIVGTFGLGIDLGNADVTPNDAGDTDGIQNYPILSSASFSNGSVRVAGTLSTVPDTSFRIELFGNDRHNNYGYGQGQHYLGFANVTTDGSGNASFDVTLPVPDTVRTISATATGPTRTSEFSAAFLAKSQNISTRASVGTGDNTVIAGLIVRGRDPKRVLFRGVGPSLNLPGALQDPMLVLYNRVGAVITANENWTDSQRQEIEATGLAPTDDREAALLMDLIPDSYTIQLRGAQNGTGVGLVEVYDLVSPGSELVNISTRGVVGTGDNVMIAGFIVGPNTGRGTHVLVRGIGPSLSTVANLLMDPLLALHDGNGALLASNDDWKTNEAEIRATTIPPTHDRESALVADLAPGAYTAILRGKNGSTGVGLVEFYNLH